MAQLTAQQITQAGLEPVYVTPTVTEGDKVANTGKQFFHVQNDSGSAITATVVPEITTVVDPLLGTLKKENACLKFSENFRVNPQAISRATIPPKPCQVDPFEI